MRTRPRATWLARVGLAKFENHYPHQLSGGMRKRVALAQTFINNPKILLMDEPFCALDVQTRIVMQDELLHLWSSVERVGGLRHARSRRGDRARRPRLRAHRRPADGEVGLRDRPAAAARDRGDSLRAAFIELSRRIWHDLREEVHISYAARSTSASKGRVMAIDRPISAPQSRRNGSSSLALAHRDPRRRRWAVGRSRRALHLIDPFFFAMPSRSSTAAVDVDHAKARRRGRCGAKCSSRSRRRCSAF